MWSLQETKDKAKTQLSRIKEVMDRYGSYHPAMQCADHMPASIYHGLSTADAYELKETLSHLTLAELLISGGPLGVSYLIPTKLNDILNAASAVTDLTPLISMQPIATKWEGGNLEVPVLDDWTYRPWEFGSGGQHALHTPSFPVKPSIVPKGFQISPLAGTDYIEDQRYDLIEWLVKKAGYSIGIKATTLALTVLKAASDGVGTVNPVTAGSDETTPAHILEAIDSVGQDEKLANTMVVTPEAWEHTISGIEVAGGTAGDYWRPLDGISFPPIAVGYHAKFHMLDVLFSYNAQLHKSTDARGAAFTDCVTIVFDRNNALATGRKRWMQIDKYADPITDLAGCTITCRQDSVTVYDDAIGVITES